MLLAFGDMTPGDDDAEHAGADDDPPDGVYSRDDGRFDAGVRVPAVRLSVDSEDEDRGRRRSRSRPTRIATTPRGHQRAPSPGDSGRGTPPSRLAAHRAAVSSGLGSKVMRQRVAPVGGRRHPLLMAALTDLDVRILEFAERREQNPRCRSVRSSPSSGVKPARYTQMLMHLVQQPEVVSTRAGR
jgi:hypothetical protein